MRRFHQEAKVFDSSTSASLTLTILMLDVVLAAWMGDKGV